MGDVVLEALKAVAAITAPIVAALICQALYKLVAKLGLAVDAEKQAKLEYLVTQAVLTAEEWGATRVKAQIPTTADQKLEQALQGVLARVPGVTREEAATLIHAQLVKLGLGAAGFFQAVRTTATGPQS